MVDITMFRYVLSSWTYSTYRYTYLKDKNYSINRFSKKLNMLQEKLRVFRLLIYKNYLVRKRHWKMGLFVEIMIPLLLFLTLWAVRNNIAPDKDFQAALASISDEKWPVDDRRDLIPYVIDLYIVPDNPFVKTMMNDVYKCLARSQITTSWFETEEDMVRAYMSSNNTSNPMAVIFKDRNINISSTQLKYKIRTKSIPEDLYAGIIPEFSDELKLGVAGLQLCLDETFIKIKGNNLYFDIYTQQMPSPAHIRPDTVDQIVRQVFCIFVLMVFLIILCVETSNASDEKFLGTNVLMTMNGVPNYLNLLSWLVSGLIFSIFYIVPMIILFSFTSDESRVPLFYYGNHFIFWLVFTFNVAHLISFGIHVSAYFSKSLFMNTGLVLLYVGAIVVQIFGFKQKFLHFSPLLGILFPNILLFRACTEINHFESILKGIHWANLFKVGDSSYGTLGSVGIMLIFSLLGIILHIILADYIYTINPGKYGAKKNPFYFLNFLRRFKKSHDYNEVENFESTDTNEELFESVAKGAYTPGIQIRNLRKSYNTSLFTNAKVHALKGISVDFYKRQITALLGHNGAGKTTMMSILTGMISPTEGLVLVNRKNVKDHSYEIMNDMGLCPQENILFPNLSVAEQLKFFAVLKNKNKGRSVNSDVTFLLQELKIFDKRNSLPKDLSGGQKRRVCLGMALIGNASILVLDEPTSGLDPESRRDIWNILLKMRGEKTILISTHDMEEADILGDRIAIVHSGNLRSCGTSLFLKRLIGRGNVEVTLSTEAWCDIEKIHNYLDPQSEILDVHDGKIELSVPQTPELPDYLDKIERNKKDLGVTGMSVSLITLERVFLKVTQDSDSKKPEPCTDNIKKLKGRERMMHSAMALLRKKMTYTIKNISVVFVMLFLIILILLSLSTLLSPKTDTDDNAQPVLVNLGMYDDARTYYTTDSNFTIPFGFFYKLVTEEFNGRTIERDSEEVNIIDALLAIGAKDMADYEYHLIAAADFSSKLDKVSFTALYNPMKALFSLPVSLNLLSNSLIQVLVDPDHGIEMQLQQLPNNASKDEQSQELREMTLIFNVPLTIVSLFNVALALFVIHPIRESMTGIKHLQRMAGTSALCYWGAMFVFDFIVFIGLTIIFIASFVVIDLTFALQMIGTIDVLIILLLFVLFAINILPVIYSVSFWRRSTSAAVKLLTLVPVILVYVECNISSIFLFFESLGIPPALVTFRAIQKGIFLVIPYISFYHGIISVFKTMLRNSICRGASFIEDSKIMENIKYCQGLECENGTCSKSLPYFNNFKDDVSLELSILCLCLTTVLCFGILCILEYQLIPKLIARMRSGYPQGTDSDFEEQVKKEKHSIAFEISKIKSRGNKKATENGKAKNGVEEISVENNDSKRRVFLVYELRKVFGKLVAVQDVSFGVNQKECFGLLGVNGAGKSTTFRMITGEEIPNNGMMYLNNKDLRENNNYLSEMGYCPQNDALIKSLNSYDHLRLFARLRGIPENQVEAQVKKWINRLNLNACASQPSGTYSGGNKRRLNIAMALIGIPNLVLLDEPTTGVDPGARRSLWSVIQSCQTSGQAVILTSHSMEECEALCNRLVIMVNGKLQCIGASQELKQRFGAGYNIQLKLNPEKSMTESHLIQKNIENTLHGQLMDQNSAYLMYHLRSSELTWRQMYDVMNELKNKYASIEDFSVLSSTLEQLFLMFARRANTSNGTKNSNV